MRVNMSDERKASVATALMGFFQSEFDEEISAFQASEITDFMIGQIGPSQYNQAISDAHAFMLTKLDDLDAELYEPE